MNHNLILSTDSYKLTHWPQYPPGTEIVHSYLEARGGAFPYTVANVGLRALVQTYLTTPITEQNIFEARDIAQKHFGNDNLFNLEGWKYILRRHDGYLPIRIKAIPEGTIIPVSTPLLTVENTDPYVPWLTNYVESLLLKLWYPMTVATLSREIKKEILYWLERTGDPNTIDFKLHDFGYRGVSSEESAKIGGMAHLVNFKGTDTLLALAYIREHYEPELMAGFSVPASEHSTMTSWGEEHEMDAMENMLYKYPTGLVSVVSDSYDIVNACSKIWGEKLHDEVLARDGVLVIRPDSGDPCTTILKVLEILGEKFDTTRNEKGFKELHPKVRIIQGDGVELSSIKRILDTMHWRGWSANNIVFGMGGALLQKVNRDTQQFAFKCSATRRFGIWHDVYKKAPGKNSKKGRFIVQRYGDKYNTYCFDENTYIGGEINLLQPIFENGKCLSNISFTEIRELAAVPMVGMDTLTCK